MVEGVRNAMMAAFQRLELWPPMPPPAGIEDDDCCYEDVNSDLPVIAQRLYNDDVRRLMAVPCDGAASPWQQRAFTAAFIVDFAEEVGVPCLPMPPTQKEMIEEFALRLEEFEARSSEAADGSEAAAEEEPPLGREHLTLGVAQQLRAETRRLTERGGQFVSEHKTALALGAVGLVGGALTAALAAGGAIVATRLARSEDEREDRSVERKSETGRWLAGSPGNTGSPVRLSGCGEFAFKEAVNSGADVSVLEGLDELLSKALWLSRTANIPEILRCLAEGQKPGATTRPANILAMTAMARTRSPRTLPPEVKQLFSVSSDDRYLRHAAARSNGEVSEQRVKTRSTAHRLSQCKAKLGALAQRLDLSARSGQPCRAEAARLLLEVALLLGDSAKAAPRSLTPTPCRARAPATSPQAASPRSASPRNVAARGRSPRSPAPSARSLSPRDANAVRTQVPEELRLARRAQQLGVWALRCCGEPLPELLQACDLLGLDVTEQKGLDLGLARRGKQGRTLPCASLATSAAPSKARAASTSLWPLRPSSTRRPATFGRCPASTASARCSPAPTPWRSTPRSASTDKWRAFTKPGGARSWSAPTGGSPTERSAPSGPCPVASQSAGVPNSRPTASRRLTRPAVTSGPNFAHTRSGAAWSYCL
ncbi:unnamed protein product [Effrenium voratum]|nr:unnamed protein product [Effrenium voratum]